MVEKHQIGTQICCPHCDKTYDKYQYQSLKLLKGHIDAYHPEHGEKKNICTICGEGFIFAYTCKGGLI